MSRKREAKCVMRVNEKKKWLKTFTCDKKHRRLFIRASERRRGRKRARIEGKKGDSKSESLSARKLLREPQMNSSTRGRRDRGKCMCVHYVYIIVHSRTSNDCERQRAWWWGKGPGSRIIHKFLRFSRLWIPRNVIDRITLPHFHRSCLSRSYTPETER